MVTRPQPALLFSDCTPGGALATGLPLCDDHQQLVGLLRDKALQPLSEALMHHFDHIVASLCL